MDFTKPVAAEGRVEDWMLAVLEEMRISNRWITKNAVFDYCYKTLVDTITLSYNLFYC